MIEYTFTKPQQFEREHILNEEIECQNGNKIPCDIQVDYEVYEGRIMVIDIEVKIMFTPAHYQESILEIIKEKFPGCEFNSSPPWKLVREKAL
jgi:hypothetical protein